MQKYSKLSFPFDLIFLSTTFGLIKSKIIVYVLFHKVEFSLLGLFCFQSFQSFCSQTCYLIRKDTPSLKRILVNGDSVIFNSTAWKRTGSQNNLFLNYRNNNITFELQPADSINYQFFLEGFDKEWSGWKKINSKDYTNLPAGKYLFKIRYISSSSSGGEISLLSLRVLPLWYFSLVGYNSLYHIFLSDNLVFIRSF